ncbi:1,3-propanediol dehydrogenase [Sporobacter termitidis DSM 10068]|uniref:1,3-propanediol dehydrogenase n=1 Tax=Sporobacter termitidis DSM 10068 TaxID=1123282 RepID=A0A1M5UHM0_9FIRM|nr:iron-containing alcohol dehydrogenase [Sporobacter termitidis]SHH62469.1 1,3-propanediol dehydrogenase [Sporobacter termitidis DSM 10068]
MYQQFSHSATVIFGWGVVSVLGEKVKELGCKKAMCVIDKGIEGTNIPGKVIKSLTDAGLDVVTFSGVVADPPVEIVDEGAALAKKEGVDCLIGIGGGSSMDTAKAISILLTKPGQAKDYILAKPIYIDTKTPVILVPTTAGTGSEVTSVAIISRPDANAKWSVFVNTTYAIVDPELTLSLPKRETANTGLDALSHAMEAMTTVNWNPHSDVMGEAAIRKITEHLVTAYNEPGNKEARTGMMLAANFAGLAFNDPITHIGHAAADALSCRFHTPHGYNCGICLPTAMKITAPATPEKMRVIAEAMGVSVTGKETGEELGDIAADKIRELMRAVNIKSLKESGFKREDVLSLAPDVVSNHLASYCPVKITEDKAREILADIYDSYQ